MGRYELTEKEWEAIQPRLPNKPRSVPRVDDRRVLNGIFWVLRSGVLVRLTRTLRPAHGDLQPLQPLAEGRGSPWEGSRVFL